MLLLLLLQSRLAARIDDLRRDERGQGAVEYVGIVIVVVAIIVAVASQADGIGTAIASGLQKVVGDFLGG